MNWIDVKNYLPPNNTYCIVYIKDENCFSEAIFNSKKYKVYNNKFIFYDSEYEIDLTKGVTHWMIPTTPI